MIIKGKLISIISIILLLGIILTIIYPQKIESKKIFSKILWTINEGYVTQIDKNGNILSKLSSSNSSYNEQDKTTNFEYFKMEYYDINNKSKIPTNISSDKAISKNQIIDLIGNVVITHNSEENNFKLTTPKAQYNTEKDLFYSNNGVEINSNNNIFTSEEIEAYVKNNNKITLSKNVSSKIYNKESNIKITADKMVNFLGEKNKLNKVYFYGNPVKYTSESEENKIYGSAKIIEYHPETEDIILINNATINKDGDILKSNYIIYNTKQKELSNKKNKDSRVKIVIKSTGLLNQKDEKNSNSKH